MSQSMMGAASGKTLDDPSQKRTALIMVAIAVMYLFQQTGRTQWQIRRDVGNTER